MQGQTIWSTWLQSLQRWGLIEPVAALLEGAGPLSMFLAQFVYFGQPFFGRALPEGHWEALARLLEDQDERRSFVGYLRQEG